MPIADDGHLHRHQQQGDSAGSCCSSPAVSPSHSFKRSKSTVYLLDRRTSPPPDRLQRLHSRYSPAVAENRDNNGGYAAFAWKLVKAVAGLPLVHALFVRVPALCLYVWLRLVWRCCARLPLTVTSRVFHFCVGGRKRRGGGVITVLINGGSAVQTLHLARNYHAVGARVIVCEVEGRSELCSFSVAVDGYYTVPRPHDDGCVQYVDALRAIVERERVGYYVPTGVTVSPYYDAVAKPHLELLGCKCCAPGLDGVSVLNDLSEVFHKCEIEGLPVPKNLRVCSKEDIVKLYDNVSFRADRHFIVNVGLSGCKTAYRLPLPAARRSLRLPGPVSADCPWLLVQNGPGSYYSTCTTVHNGKVLGNVTCSARDHRPTNNVLVDDWVTHFVESLPFAFDGVLAFHVCVTPSRNVVPLDCRVGVPTEYTSYRSNLERILLYHQTCSAHEPLEPEMCAVHRYYAPALLFAIALAAHPAAVKQLVHTAVTGQEMVFACWDPMPGFAFYSLQLLADYLRDALDSGTSAGLTVASGQKNKFTTF